MVVKYFESVIACFQLLHKDYKKILNKISIYNNNNNIIFLWSKSTLAKFNIPAFQHRIIHRLSVFSFKMLNFVSAPKNLKEVFFKSLCSVMVFHS